MAGPDHQVRARTESMLSKRVWREHKSQIKYSLNVVIFPFLVRDSLISEEDRLRYIDSETSGSEVGKRRDFIMKSIPRSGQPDYVVRFIKCLRESAHEAGVAHEELADAMENDYNKHKRNQTRFSVSQTLTTTWDPETGESTATASVSFTGTTLGNPSINVPPRRDYQEYHPSILHLLKKYSKWICVHFSAILWILLGAILSGILTHVPPINEFHPNPIHGNPNIRIDLGVDPYWISSAVFSTSSTCSGSVAYVVGNSTCEDLPQVTREVDQDGIADPLFIYLLSGSSINITVRQRSSLEDVEIWILQTIDNYRGRSSLVCDHPPPKTWCYRASQYVGVSLPFFNVNQSDYYFLWVNTRTIFFYSTYTFKFVTFNMTAILDQFHPMGTTIGQSSEVEISRLFSQNSDICIIMTANCPSSNSDYSLTRDEITRRIDLILSPLLVGLLACILHLMISCSVHFGSVRIANNYCKKADS